jgi:DNA repair protein RecN (Recombination protein N)
MLLELEIENLATFRAVRASFGPGLNALTGETGAGKTLVLNALALLRGQRADRAKLRDGEDEARVSGLFRVPDPMLEELAELLAPAPLEDSELLLTRTVGRDGRGRCYANGRLVPAAAFKAAGSRLIELLGQGEARLLAEADHRAHLLDAYSGGFEAHALYLAARERALARRERRDRLERERMQRRERLDYLRYVLAEIEAVAPRPGEAAELGRELDVLAKAEELRALCSEGCFSLYDSENAAAVVIERLRRRIEQLGGGSRELLEPAAAALDRARVEVEEANAELRAAAERIDSDPARLATLEERLHRVTQLLVRYGPDEARLFATAAAANVEIGSLERDDEDSDGAAAELERATAELEVLAAALDEKRLAAGKALAKSVVAELKRLAMPKARFEVRLGAHHGATILDRATLAGASRVDFLLAANPGLEARPLEEVASGGEAARIALAMQASLAEVHGVPFLVFDEIESGVGSRLGEVVGESLARIAKDRQVLVVTHLPAVAARAARHLKVEKKSGAKSTESTITTLTGEAREHEIAAMLRGESRAGSALRSAREMLEEAP